MEFPGIRVANIMQHSGCGGVLLGFRWLRDGCCRPPAFPGRVLDLYTWLGVIGVHTKADARAVILNRKRLHQHTTGKKVVPLKKRRYPVEDMIGRRCQKGQGHA